MRIDKAQVLDILRSLGRDTGDAERELPDQVDTDEHSDLLGRFGISGGELLEQFGGGSAAEDENRDDGDPPPDVHEKFGASVPGGLGGLRGAGSG